MAVVTVVVLVRCDSGKVAEVAEALADLDEVYEAYSVSGDVDLIAIVRFMDFEQIADIISGRIAKIPGVVKTSSYVAFRQYSRRDLDDAFSLD